MEKWKEILSSCVTDSAGLSRYLKIDKKEVDRVIERYPMKINTYYLGLIRKKGDPIWKQCVPDIPEIRLRVGVENALLEERYTPVEGLVHRYKDRVLMEVAGTCAGLCRFCTRKRKMGREKKVLKEKDLERVFRYIDRHKSVRDVIISGGDPLILEDDRIEHYLKNLRKIKHVEIIRIDSRTPCVLPQRITPGLCGMLKKYAPLYFNTQFNHYREITEESRRACTLLADSGIPLGNQSVLLAGVNDDARTLKKLYEGLLTMRVRPYYLYIPDATKGTYHFRVSIARARGIMRDLIGHTSGLAVPHLIIDLQGGGGKVPLLPEYIIKREGRRYVFRNFENRKFCYTDVG